MEVVLVDHIRRLPDVASQAVRWRRRCGLAQGGQHPSTSSEGTPGRLEIGDGADSLDDLQELFRAAAECRNPSL
jgi:hypothetical protein